MSANIDELWQDIEGWLRAHAPDRYAELRDGADARAIETLETAVGVKLPSDYAASLRRHDGSAYLTSYLYLDSKAVAARWKAMQGTPTRGRQVDNPEAGVIEPVWWSSAWIPFAEDSGGNLLCLDTKPGPNGTVGQVVMFENSMGPGPADFSSFQAWLADYRDGLLDGRFVADESGFIYEA